MPLYKGYRGNRLDLDQLPATFTCKICFETKRSVNHYFTSKEMDRWCKDPKAKLRCRECAGDIPSDIWCFGCDRPKAKEEFSMGARNRPANARCKQCNTWQEVVEPTTEALAIPAPEACPENEGDGYVLPTDEDNFPALGSKTETVKVATQAVPDDADNEFLGFGHSHHESENITSANVVQKPVKVISKGQGSSAERAGTKSFDTRYAPVIEWLDTLSEDTEQGHEPNDVQSLSGLSLYSVADSFKDLDPFEKANSDLKFTLAKTFARSPDDNPPAAVRSFGPTPYSKSTTAPKTAEEKKEALARILGKPAKSTNFNAAALASHGKRHLIPTFDLKSDTGSSTVSTMPVGLQPALTPSVPNLMDEPVNGKPVAVTETAWAKVPTLSAKRLVLGGKLKGSAKEFVPASAASSDSGKAEQEAPSTRAPMNVWLQRNNFVDSDVKATNTASSIGIPSVQQTSSAWKSVAAVSCTKESVEKSLKLLAIGDDAPKATLKTTVTKSSNGLTLLDSSEKEYPTLGSVGPKSTGTMDSTGRSAMAAKKSKDEGTLIDFSTSEHSAPITSGHKLANNWRAPGASDTTLYPAKAKSAPTASGKKLIDFSGIDPFKSSTVKKENLKMKSDASTTVASEVKKPFAEPLPKPASGLAERAPKPSKTVQSKKPAVPVSAVANRFAMLMDDGGDDDGEDDDEDEEPEEIRDGDGFEESGHAQSSWW